MIPRKMNLQGSARELGAQIGQAQEFVSAHKHMYGVRHSCQTFEIVHLIKKASSAGHLPKMLGFIDDEGTRLSKQQGFFQCSTQIWNGEIAFDHESSLLVTVHIAHIVGDFVCNEGLIESEQSPGVVILPVEVA